MSKWIITIVLASIFYLFPQSGLYFSALLWGALLARHSVNRNLFLALLIAGLLMMYVCVPTRLQLPLYRVAMLGFLCGGILIGISFARKFLAADMKDYLREQERDMARFNQLLRESLGTAKTVLAGESAEIFFSLSDDRFARAVAERYQQVGWRAVVYYVPLPFPHLFGGDHVVVITAPRNPHELQTSLITFAFWTT
ncbi:unnamed protein product [Sphagnum jensenii]